MMMTFKSSQQGQSPHPWNTPERPAVFFWGSVTEARWGPYCHGLTFVSFRLTFVFCRREVSFRTASVLRG